MYRRESTTATFKLDGAYPRGQRGVVNTGQSKEGIDDLDDSKLNKNADLNLVTIRRKAQLSDGIYIRGKLQGATILFTADTGASKTVLSKRVFYKLDANKRPSLQKSNSLKGAGGTPLNEIGKGHFTIQLGPLELEREMIVADIEDDCLLGIDILQNESEGPADLLLSKGIIRLLGKDIPCTQVGLNEKTRKVTAADDFVIPGQSEAVIDVFVARDDTDDLIQDSDFLIEGSESFHNKYPLKVAAKLVDINSGARSKLLVLNPFKSSG